MPPNSVTIVPSLLDRLTMTTNGPAVRQTGWNAALVQLKRSLRRDLEALLNTRRRPGWLGRDLPELGRSPIRYGIPDFTAIDMAAQDRQAAFGRALETVIRDFEPRLGNVSVTLLTPDRDQERILRFRVEALIRIEPTPEPIVFESVLDPISRTFSIKATPDD
ncbi:type VI secretion system baseplate subunit TssE [Telmatospirillum sp.]|uniref:type VI secretion system baseplate subunit TssE n=1 Tax=Telmatospirillum sp. TaxID=2079197 RepID=UPI00283F1503|nr:type VI secretion system baseplate subunit TssE [Telmatospirillum sp.]MDR3435251.1 type VI secretion system baseplate subunit TssE [Telmatospirillum sp.]